MGIMQQFGASMFHTVMRWHKLGEVESECILHNSIVLALFVPKIVKLVEVWQSYDKKQFWLFFETRCKCTNEWYFIAFYTVLLKAANLAIAI